MGLPAQRAPAGLRGGITPGRAHRALVAPSYDKLIIARFGDVPTFVNANNEYMSTVTTWRTGAEAVATLLARVA